MDEGFYGWGKLVANGCLMLLDLVPFNFLERVIRSVLSVGCGGGLGWDAELLVGKECEDGEMV